MAAKTPPPTVADLDRKKVGPHYVSFGVKNEAGEFRAGQLDVTLSWQTYAALGQPEHLTVTLAPAQA